MNAREERDVADLSPGTVLVAGSTGWRYRVQGVDRDADRVILCGPRGSLAAGYRKIQRGVMNGQVVVFR